MTTDCASLSFQVSALLISIEQHGQFPLDARYTARQRERKRIAANPRPFAPRKKFRWGTAKGAVIAMFRRGNGDGRIVTLSRSDVYLRLSESGWTDAQVSTALRHLRSRDMAIEWCGRGMMRLTMEYR